jgi:hypothetical protein
MNDESTPRTFATLRIVGKTLSPAEITVRLQLTPTETKAIGEARGRTAKWPHTYWEFSSRERIHSTELNDHLLWLTSAIEPTLHELQQLQAEEFLVDIFCFLEITSSQGGISIAPEVSRRLGVLNLDLGLDIYFVT